MREWIVYSIVMEMVNVFIKIDDLNQFIKSLKRILFYFYSSDSDNDCGIL